MHIFISFIWAEFQLVLLLITKLNQGRSQELEMGGAKLLGEGSGGRLRPPVGPGQKCRH